MKKTSSLLVDLHGAVCTRKRLVLQTQILLFNGLVEI